MKIAALLGFFVCIGTVAVWGQSPYFRLLSFVVDDKEVTDYSVVFTTVDERYEAVRSKDRIYLPENIKGVSEVSVEFRTDTLSIIFPYVQIGAYLDTDELKQDFKLRVDRRPFPSDITAKYDVSRICRIDSLTRIPQISRESKLIADPVTFRLLRRCD